MPRSEQRHREGMGVPPVEIPENMRLNYVLRCQLSGLFIGRLEVITTVGSLPYLSHWQEMVARHPVFSMSEGRLLSFTTNEWRRLAKKAADEEITENESNVLCVCYLALLHSLDCIKQDKDLQILPPMHIVYNTMPKLLALSYWKYHLESKRFSFPTYHISRANNNGNFSDIGAYLDLCFEIKDDYEMKINDEAEKQKAKEAADAIKVLNNTWVIPPSKKQLWNWVKAHLLPTKYAPDCEGWLSTLFLGGSQTIVNDFEKADIEMMEEIIVSECPAGTGVMHAVRGRIDSIWRIWKEHHEAFEVDMADYAKNQGVLVNAAPITHPDPGAEPNASQYQARAKFLVAHAQWKVAKAAYDRQQAGQKPVSNKALEEI